MKTTEDKHLLFISPDLTEDEQLYYYPYYPDDPDLSPDPEQDEPVYHPNLTIFEVYNVDKNETYKSLKYFLFEKELNILSKSIVLYLINYIINKLRL